MTDDETKALVGGVLDQLGRLQVEMHELRTRLQALIPQEDGTVPFVVSDIVGLDTLERRYVDHVLRQLNGNKTHAAEVLKVDPSTLHRKLSRWEELPDC